MGRPYIYYLFYTKTDPSIFRRDVLVERDAFGFVHVNRIGKYYFNNVLNKGELGENMHVEKSDKIPEGATVLKTFNLPDGKQSLSAYVEN